MLKKITAKLSHYRKNRRNTLSQFAYRWVRITRKTELHVRSEAGLNIDHI